MPLMRKRDSGSVELPLPKKRKSSNQPKEEKRKEETVFDFLEEIGYVDDHNHALYRSVPEGIDEASHHVAKNVVSLLNADGGILAYGVRPNNGKVYGETITRREQDVLTNSTIDNAMKRIVPSVGVDLYSVFFTKVKDQEDKFVQVVRIKVAKGKQVYEDLYHKAYVRKGTSIHGPLTPHEIKDITIKHIKQQIKEDSRLVNLVTTPLKKGSSRSHPIKIVSVDKHEFKAGAGHRTLVQRATSPQRLPAAGKRETAKVRPQVSSGERDKEMPRHVVEKTKAPAKPLPPAATSKVDAIKAFPCAITVQSDAKAPPLATKSGSDATKSKSGAVKAPLPAVKSAPPPVATVKSGVRARPPVAVVSGVVRPHTPTATVSAVTKAPPSVAKTGRVPLSVKQESHNARGPPHSKLPASHHSSSTALPTSYTMQSAKPACYTLPSRSGGTIRVLPPPPAPPTYSYDYNHSRGRYPEQPERHLNHSQPYSQPSVFGAAPLLYHPGSNVAHYKTTNGNYVAQYSTGNGNNVAQYSTGSGNNVAQYSTGSGNNIVPHYNTAVGSNNRNYRYSGV